MSVIVAVVTVPWYLRLVGEARYGVLAFIMVILNYFTVFDFGLDRAVANRLAQTDARDRRRTSEVFWSALAVNACVGALGGVILFVAASAALPYALHASRSLHAETAKAVVLLAVALPVMTVLSVVIGAFEGRERFFARSVILSASGVLIQLLPIASAYLFTPDITHLVGATVVAQAITLVCAFVSAVWFIGIDPLPRFSAADAKALMRFGSWITVSGVISPLLTIMDRFAIGVVLGPIAVATYTIPFSVVTRIWMIPDAFSRVLFPRLSALGATRARDITRQAVDRLVLLVTPVTLVSILLAAPALRIWLGGRVGPEAVPVAEILLVGVWVNSIATAPYVYLQARGRPDLPARYHVLELLPYVAFLWLSLRHEGVVGAALVWTGRVTVDAILMYRASLRLSGSSKYGAWASIGARALPVLAAFALVQGSSSLYLRFGGSVFVLGTYGLSAYRKWANANQALPHPARAIRS